MASAKSSNSKVRSICFFSSSHSGIFFRRTFSSSAFIKSAITGQRVTPEICFAMPKSKGFFGHSTVAGGADAGPRSVTAATTKERECGEDFRRNRKFPPRRCAPPSKALPNPTALLSLPFPLRARRGQNGIRSPTVYISPRRYPL